MTGALAIQSVVYGLTIGLTYVLIASGLTLVFSIMNIVNFAHCEFYMLGAFGLYYVIQYLGVDVWLATAIALVLAFVALALFGAAIERTLFRPFQTDHLPPLVISVGLSALLSTSAMLLFGTVVKSVPAVSDDVLRIAGVAVSVERLFVIGVTAIVVTCLYFFIWHTRWGLAMRAVAQDRDAAALQGMDVGRTISLAMAIGSGMAGLAGVVIAPLFTVDPFMGGPALMKSFTVVVLGGMGSVPGAVLGGLIMGLVDGFVAAMLGIPVTLVIGLAVIILVVLIRPSGMFGRA